MSSRIVSSIWVSMKYIFFAFNRACPLLKLAKIIQKIHQCMNCVPMSSHGNQAVWTLKSLMKKTSDFLFSSTNSLVCLGRVACAEMHAFQTGIELILQLGVHLNNNHSHFQSLQFFHTKSVYFQFYIFVRSRNSYFSWEPIWCSTCIQIKRIHSGNQLNSFLETEQYNWISLLTKGMNFSKLD